MSATVGPQDPKQPGIEGIIRVVIADPCNPADIGDVKDKIVVLGLNPPSPCSYEKMYIDFQTGGAKAVLCQSLYRHRLLGTLLTLEHSP